MIALLTGNFLAKTPTQLIIDVAGVGYEVQISLNTYAAIEKAERGSLFTYLKVAEDSLTIFGFNSLSEKEVFVKLIGVSGIGAGTARMVLSNLLPEELVQAIATGNVKLLESIKGIGKKTAERMVLELRDKLGGISARKQNSESTHWNNTIEQDALNALIALGIGKSTAELAIQKATKEVPDQATLEDLIKASLKSI